MTTRRTLLKFIGVSAAASALRWSHLAQGAGSPARALGRDVENYLGRSGPIDRGNLVSGRFTGDDFNHLAHAYLQGDAKAGWMKNAAPGRKTEETDVVVIGGGVSGLFSAYLLRRHKPVVLERAARLGGNSRGESWNGIDYSIGAAYFVEPERGTELYKLFDELGFLKMCRLKTEEDPILFEGKRYDSFWNGETDPGHASQFLRLHKHFSDMLEGKNGLALPEVPCYDERARPLVDKLDGISLRDYLQALVKPATLHPHIDTALEHYCWSSCGAGMKDLSAACGLGQLVPEFGGIRVPPGGNSALAEQLCAQLYKAVGPGNLRANSLALDVSVSASGDHVVVHYIEQSGKTIRTIRCKAAIMACPKFVVAKVLGGIEPGRRDAIAKLQYTAYLVGNVLLKGPVKEEFYDCYLLADGKVVGDDPETSSDRHGITDVVLATYARADRHRSVITLYRSFPYRGGRGKLVAAGSYGNYRGLFKKQIEKEILPGLKINATAIEDIRMTRWGHPLPVAAPGLIKDKVIDQIREPFRERVFFVEQDNWMQPALETCAEEAIYWAKKVEKIL